MHRTSRFWTLGCLLVTLVLAVPAAAKDDAAADPAQRRAAVQAAAGQGVDGIPQLVAALDDADALVRRAAVRALGQVGAPATPHLVAALNHADALVRRLAVLGLGRLNGEQTVTHLTPALADADAMVRQAVVQVLTGIQPRTPAVVELLKQARKDPVAAVRDPAAAALWPFHQTGRSLRDQPDLDFELTVAQAIPLPTTGWKFHTDLGQDGHLAGWFNADFDDHAWTDIGIGQAWQAFGHDYVGVAWYRGTFTLPEAPQAILGTDLRFEGVDEGAWVWINGVYVGRHDVGPSGWNQPFALEVSNELKWGEANQITVRVLNVAQAGGIWKPVTLEALRR